MTASHDDHNSSAADADPLDDLLATLCDGNALPETYEQLGQRLTGDAAARQKYLDCLLVHSLLEWDRAAVPVTADAASRTIARPAPIVPSLEPAAPAGFARGLGWNQPQFSLWAVLAAVLLSSGATFGILQWRRAPAQVPAAALRSAAQPAEYVATLVSAGGVRWDHSEQPVRDGARLPAGEVRLAEGVIEIMFDSGVKVLLQGPARFLPQSSRSGLLRAGRLVAQCPPRSPPFAVQTAAAVAVGSGAEFACEAAVDGTSKVHVYAGQVEVAGRSHRFDAASRERLSAGEALLVEAAAEARLVPLASLADEFVRAVPQRRRHFPAGLVAYWNFDEQGGPAFDLAGHNHGLLQGVTRTAGLVGGGAIDFANRPGQQVSVGAEGDTFRFTSGIAVEALFVSRWSGKQGDYDEIFRKEDGGERFLLSFQNDRMGNQVEPKPVPARPVLAFGLNVAGIYSELEVPLDGQEGRPTLAQLTDGHVHHVVASYDVASGLKALYLDGQERASQRLAEGAAIRCGGAQPSSVGNIFGGWEPFSGTLDEAAVYDRALSPAEVAAHWQQAQSGRGYFEVPEAPGERPATSDANDKRSI